MSNTQEPVDISNDDVLIGPGQILHDARIEQGLTEQQVAEHLNLRPMLIAQIENNEFDSTTPEIFVRGYLKNFAKFIGASETEVLASYESLTIARHQGTQMQSFSQVTRQKTENNRLMMIIYFIIFVLVMLTVVWWMQDTDNKAVDESKVQQNIVKEVDAIKVDSVNGDVMAEDIANSDITDDSEPVVIDNSPALIEANTLNSTSVIPAEQSLAVITSQPVSVAESENQNITPLETVVFTFVGDCWVNIFDANGDRLAWGIKRADYKMTLTGKAPFTITLGKPELVSIEYNSETVDLSQFLPGQIAKFVWPKA